MPLQPVITQFKTDLIKAEDTPTKTPAEAARRFGKAFTTFFSQATVSSTSMVVGTHILPPAVKALEAGLTIAFTQPNTAQPFCGQMQTAFDNYWFASVVTMWPGLAAAKIPSVPNSLYGLLKTLGFSKSQASAKGKLAQKIAQWVMTQTVQPPGAPPPLPVFFV